jgi:hypothetical protein
MNVNGISTVTNGIVKRLDAIERMGRVWNVRRMIGVVRI